MMTKDLLEKLKFSTYVIFHPFKGFWELKKEKKGNYASAGILVALLVVVFIIRRQLTGFIFNTNDVNEMNIFFEISGVLLPFILWCIANWCITTLMDGEGNFKEIVITTAYAITPLILINIPLVILSNIITINDGSIYYFLDAVALLWTGALLVFGLMTIHEFTFSKTILTAIIAIVGMIIIVFIGLLFFALVQQIANFLGIIYRELALRYNW